MNIVILRKKNGNLKQIKLSGIKLKFFSLLIFILIGSVTFSSGYILSKFDQSNFHIKEMNDLRSSLESAHRNINDMRQNAVNVEENLTIKMGKIAARMTSIDRITQEVVKLSDIDLLNLADSESIEWTFDKDKVHNIEFTEIPPVVLSMEILERNLIEQEQQIKLIENIMLDDEIGYQIYPNGRPVRSGWLSSYYGRRIDPFTGNPAMHRGVDFAGKDGDSIFAVADGVVIWSADRYGFGQLIEINHGNGFATRYAHNKENLVKVGDKVKRGQEIALMGDTGRSTGINLHFEVLKNGENINPAPFLRRSAD